MWRSPTALTVMSMRECRANRSSIWSKKPIPVATLDTPDPSRLTVTSISVSLVLRLMVALRMDIFPLTNPLAENAVLLTGRLLTGRLGLRHCGIPFWRPTSGYGDRNQRPSYGRKVAWLGRDAVL